MLKDDDGSSECVSEEEMAEVKQDLAAVRSELGAVRREMERRVDQLHSQLHYWQNVTVNILKVHYSSLDTSNMWQLVHALSFHFIKNAGRECR